MWVADDQFFADSIRHRIEIEPVFFPCHFRMKNHLQQDIAELFNHQRIVFQVNRFADFVNLFDKVAADALMRLFAIPRTPFR